MFKRRVSVATLVAVMLNMAFLVVSPAPALAATNATGSFGTLDSACPVQVAAVPSGCTFLNSLYIRYTGPKNELNTGKNANTFLENFAPQANSSFDFMNGCGMTIHLSASTPTKGTLTNTACLGPGAPASIALALTNPPSAVWFQTPVIPDPLSNNINISVTVDFGKIDANLGTPSLPEGIDIHTSSRIGAPPSGRPIGPNISTLTAKVVSYSLVGAMTTAVPGTIYNVCVGDGSGTFILPGPLPSIDVLTDGEICQRVKKTSIANTVKFSLKGDPTKLTAAAGAIACDTGGGFTWLICDSIKTLVIVVDTIRDDVIVPFLKEPPLDRNQNGVKPVYKIWSAFRDVASIFFILVFFLVIIGTAVGFDNYTIKKVLPHLVAGAILVPFSWYLCAFVVDIGNVLGQGLVALMTGVIGTPKIDLSSSFTQLFLGVGGGAAGFALEGAAAVLGLAAIISLLIAFTSVFLTLIFRKILLLFLIILSPFALLAWVLPNTEKWFKEWWQNFFKLVMMYPIIMLLIEVGRLFSATAGATAVACAAGDAACKATAWVTPFFAIAGLTVPLFAVPFAFKFAGKGLALGNGAITKLGGSVDKKYGKDSNFAKDLSEGRQRKNFEASNRAKDAAVNAHGLRKIGLQRKAAFQMQRAGLSGISGSARLRRQAATPKLAGELDALDGEKRAAIELDRETFAQRRAAGTQSFVDERAAARGTRQGILDGYEGGGRPIGKLKQSQARIKSRDSYAAGIGAAQGDVEDDRLNERERLRGSAGYVSTATKVAAARDTTALQASEARGSALGVVRGGIEAERILRDQTGLGAAAARDLRLRNVAQAKSNLQVAATVTTQQTANTNVSTNLELDQKQIADGNAITPLQARSLRLKNLSAATHGQERERIGAAEGQIDARNDITTTTGGQEHINALVGGERLAAREQIATARTLRDTRTELQATQEGHLSTREVLDSSKIEASKRLGTSIGAQKQELDQHQVDTAKALRDGNPAPRPSDYVIAGTEAAKARTAQESAQRLAAVNADREGTAATTVEHTDAAVYQAERATALSNATTKGVAGTVNAEIESAARNIQAASAVPITTAAAMQQAAQEIRTRNLDATTQVGRAAAEAKTALEINTDLGTSDAINNEIDTEVTRLQATPLGATLTPAQARDQAETNVRARQIDAVSQVGRSQSSVKAAADRNQTVGVQDSLQSQIVEETDRLQSDEVAAGRPPLSAADAAARAQANIRRNQIENAGAVIRQKSARDDRQTTDTTAGTADELDHEVKRKMDLTGKTKAEAEDSVRARDLNAIGTNSKDAAQRKAGQERGTEIGTKLAIDAELDSEISDIKKADPAISDSAARAQAQANVKTNNINIASRASQITAQGARIQAPKKDQGVIKAYEAAIDNATQAPLADAREAARKKEYDTAYKTEGDKAYIRAYARQKDLSNKVYDEALQAAKDADAADIKAGSPAKSADEIKIIAAEARKKHEDNANIIAQEAREKYGNEAGNVAGKAAADAIKDDSIVPLTPRDAEKNVINSLGVQAQEQAMRAEAASQGTTAAFNQAVKAKGALEPEQRLAAQTETAVASLASESAAVRARYDLTRPGEPLNRSYEDAEKGAAELEKEKILDVRTTEALRRPITYRTYEMEKGPNGEKTDIPKLNPDGTPETITVNALKDAELSNEALQGMRDEIIQLTKADEPQTDRVIALMNRLGQSGPGQEELRYLKREIFHGTDHTTVDPTLFKGQAKMIWDKGIFSVSRDSAPDLHIPQIAINDGVSPEAFAKMNWRSKRDYIDYVTSDRAPKKDKQRLMQEAADAMVGVMNNKQLSGKLDSDDYKVMVGFFKEPIRAGNSELPKYKKSFTKGSDTHGQFLDKEEIVEYNYGVDRLNQKKILSKIKYGDNVDAGRQAIETIMEQINKRGVIIPPSTSAPATAPAGGPAAPPPAPTPPPAGFEPTEDGVV